MSSWDISVGSLLRPSSYAGVRPCSPPAITPLRPAGPPTADLLRCRLLRVFSSFGSSGSVTCLISVAGARARSGPGTRWDRSTCCEPDQLPVRDAVAPL